MSEFDANPGPMPEPSSPGTAETSVIDPPDYVVGVGASAGGLEALERMFRNVPLDLKFAYVVVQHLSPDFKSVMDELLRRWTSLEVVTASNDAVLRADTIYLLPPRKEITVTGDRLCLTEKEPRPALTLPIDRFFSTLAAEWSSKAIGVVLSGTGSDGSRGIQAIHEAGGLVISQMESTAKFDGMPRSARDTGAVDLILSPEAIGGALRRYRVDPNRNALAQALELPRVDEDNLATIFRLLQEGYGLDFSHYKTGTIARRTERRMFISQISHLNDYVRKLREDRDELDTLYHDLLIGVTRFFRDHEAFEVLAEDVLRERLAQVDPESEFRVWSVGCATGEEAYSLAIIIMETMEALGVTVPLKVFATDVHRESLTVASRGVYRAEALSELSPERLMRFFVQVGSQGYRVTQQLRQKIVFAPHNIIKDAPFNQLDLVVCRNMLIYLRNQAQRRALASFHFGLTLGGVLFLGPSETAGELEDSFESINDRWKIYQRTPNDSRVPDLRLGPSTESDPEGMITPTRPSGTASRRMQDIHLLGFYDSLLGDFMPPSLLVDSERKLLHKFGGAGQFLQELDGRVSNDTMDRLLPNLRNPVSNAFFIAARERRPASMEHVVVELQPGQTGTYRVIVRPIVSQREASVCYLIQFENLGPAESHEALQDAETALDSTKLSSSQIRSLSEELQHTRENLQATIEELETSNEELQATNEELVASNEELQSTNEELNSVNEELYTVNAEYQTKIAELTELTDDMEHLLQSTQIHTVFLDDALQIRKYTPGVAGIFHLLPYDIGRRFDNFSHNIERPELMADIETVLDDGTPIRVEVRDRSGHWFYLRILPYLGNRNQRGVVLTLIDIEMLKQAQTELQLSQQKYQDLYNYAPNAYLTIDINSGHVTECNQTLLTMLDQPSEHLVGKPIFDQLDDDSRAIAKQFLARFGEAERPAGPIQVRVRRLDRSIIEVDWSAIEVRDSSGVISAIRSVWLDVTPTNQALRDLRASEQRFDRAVHGTTDGIWDWPDVEQDHQWWSPRFYQLLGYEPVELASTLSIFKALMHPEDREQFNASVAASLDQGRPLDLELRIQVKAGREQWFRIRGRSTAVPEGPRRLSGSLSDISEAKTIEQNLARTNARLQSIMSSPANVAIIATSAQETILEFSQGAEQLLGYRSQDVVNQFQAMNLISAEDVEDHARRLVNDGSQANPPQVGIPLLVACSQSGDPSLHEWHLIRADGSRLCSALQVSPRYVQDRLDGYLIIAQDITQHKQAQQAALESVRRRDQFLALLSHELRNPLAAIASGLELLRVPGLSDPQRYHERIGRQVHQLTTIVDDLLNASHVQAGKMPLQLEIVELSEIARRSIDAVEDRARDARVQLFLEPAPKPMTVRADPAKIEQAIVNLLTNAIKYSPRGSRIRVCGRIDRLVGCLDVIDQGVGLEPSQIESIFEPFHQVPSTSKKSSSGLGLGLTLARRIVELHDGTLRVRSDGLGRGSTFELRIPLTQETSTPTTQSEIRRSGQPRRILVVDDQAEIAEFLQSLLQMAGHDVQLEQDGPGAIRQARQSKPEVLLLDIDLPGCDGCEVVRQLRSEPDLSQALMIAISGFGTTADIARSLQAGFDHHLIKPITFAQISQLIDSFQGENPQDDSDATRRNGNDEPTSEILGHDNGP